MERRFDFGEGRLGKDKAGKRKRKGREYRWKGRGE